MAPIKLAIVLTSLGWAVVLLHRPTYFRGQREWGRGIHVFSAADIDILGVRPFLVVDRPVEMLLVPGGVSRWTFHQYPLASVAQLKVDGKTLRAADDTPFYRFCGEFARLLECQGAGRIPLAVRFGSIVPPFGEGEDMSDVKQSSLQIVLGAILAQGHSKASGAEKKAAALAEITEKLKSAGASRAGEPELQKALGEIIDGAFAFAATSEAKITKALDAARSAR